MNADDAVVNVKVVYDGDGVAMLRELADQLEAEQKTVEKLRAAAKAACVVLESEFGNACRNGYFHDVKPVLDNLRAALGDSE